MAIKSNLYKVIKTRTGLGLATKVPINKGEVVIEYVGNMVETKWADEHPNRYLFHISKKWTIDGSMRSNTARYLNHSCRPNCEAEQRGKRIFICAKRAIKAGEELTFDYGKEYFDEYIKPIGCKCAWHLAQAEKKLAQSKTTA